MKVRIIICFIFFITSCNVPDNYFKCPAADINNETLKKSINDYIKFLTKDNGQEDITIYFEMLDDTTSVTLINLYPDTTMTKINGALNNGRFKLYFTGANPNLYSINQNKQCKLISRSKSNKEKGISNLKHTEPLVWKLYFLKDSLIKYSY